jgi:hypothetical protein
MILSFFYTPNDGFFIPNLLYDTHIVMVQTTH